MGTGLAAADATAHPSRQSFGARRRRPEWASHFGPPLRPGWPGLTRSVSRQVGSVACVRRAASPNEVRLLATGMLPLGAGAVQRHGALAVAELEAAPVLVAVVIPKSVRHPVGSSSSSTSSTVITPIIRCSSSTTGVGREVEVRHLAHDRVEVCVGPHRHGVRLGDVAQRERWALAFSSRTTEAVPASRPSRVADVDRDERLRGDVARAHRVERLDDERRRRRGRGSPGSSAPGGLGVVAEQRPDLRLLRRRASASRIGSRRSWSRSAMRSAASSGAIVASRRAASASERELRNSRWCSGSSSSKTSASSSRSWPTASMISSPSSCEAASTRSAIWAGRRRASLRYGMRRRAVGTWATNGSMLSQSTIEPGPLLRAIGRGSDPAQDATAARVDADDLPVTVDAGELDLVGADQPPAHQVDQVARRQVAGEQQLAGAALELAEVDRVAPELDVVGAQLVHLGDRDEVLALADARDDAGHRGVGTSAELDDDVLDPADPLAGAVEEGAADDGGEMQDLWHRALPTTPRCHHVGHGRACGRCAPRLRHGRVEPIPPRSACADAPLCSEDPAVAWRDALPLARFHRSPGLDVLPRGDDVRRLGQPRSRRVGPRDPRRARRRDQLRRHRRRLLARRVRGRSSARP